MFCPRCGQQQSSGELRYCTRCGFPLEGVMELLNNGGAYVTSQASASQAKASPRYKGVRQGAALMLIGAVIVPLLGALHAAPELIGFTAILCFVGGLMRILYALILQEGAPRRIQVAPPQIAPPFVPAQLGTPPLRNSTLPPTQSAPVINWPATPSPSRRINTAELIQPPSVTENTTKLLDKKTEPPAE
jgi:hypothetical protein